MPGHKIFSISFSSVYPLDLAKVERKGRTRLELDQVIRWLTGYTPKQLSDCLEDQRDFEAFFAMAPQLNANRLLIKGVVCGVRVEEVAEPLMREIRYLDKLVDELAKGKSLDKILRTQA